MNPEVSLLGTNEPGVGDSASLKLVLWPGLTLVVQAWASRPARSQGYSSSLQTTWYEKDVSLGDPVKRALLQERRAVLSWSKHQAQ